MMKQSFFSFSILLLFLLQCTTTVAQPIPAPLPPPTPPSPTASPPAPPLPTSSPPAPLVPAAAPGPSGPTNVTKILEKAKGFSLFIRLLKSTSVADQIEKQLNDSSNGVTIFAPTDGAFSSLSSGVLNSLNDEEKEELVQFHVISSYIPLSQFQTVSNPLRTNAGDTSKYTFPLNVTAYPNSVNISTGITNTSLSGTVYSDGQLAIYQVDKVLLPWNIFGAKPPAPASSPTKRKKESDDSTSDDTTVTDSSSDDKVNASGAISLKIKTMQNMVFSGVAMVAATIFSL
ncbi:fasciclin-like arabinogalactan protein 12 [Pistacia vera]|uniref:fasciclin-like arabinogalactan protein 12 n=1 Tax=Pistacia vera TaxID=55513 RepID=UPI001263B5F0|nr:fasciclin-like arabinogalactan protein 12 [Pistacia vera]